MLSKEDENKMCKVSSLWNKLRINSTVYKYFFEEIRSMRTAKTQTDEEKKAFKTYTIKQSDDENPVGSLVIRKGDIENKIDENFIVIGLGSNPRLPVTNDNLDQDEENKKSNKLENTRLNTLLSAKKIKTINGAQTYVYAKYLLQFDISTLPSNSNADFKRYSHEEVLSNLNLAYDTFRYFLEKVENSPFDYFVTLGYGQLGKELLQIKLENNRLNGERYFELLNNEKTRKHLREAGPSDYPLHISTANYKNVRSVQDDQLKKYFLK